jgi:hypothetical protein
MGSMNIQAGRVTDTPYIAPSGAPDPPDIGVVASDHGGRTDAD